MKWIYFRGIFGFALTMMVIQSFAHEIKETIFGLTNAQTFQSKHTGDFFIQMGSFSNKLNATNYLKSLRLKSSLPTVIESKNGYYRVAIGPVHSALQVRSIGQSLNVTPIVVTKNTRLQKVSVQAKSMRQKATQPARAKSIATPIKVVKPKHTQQPSLRPLIVQNQTTTPANHTRSGVWKDMQQPAPFRAGPYIGASVGYQTIDTSPPAVYKGVEGTLSLGWGHLWPQRFYLAGEVFGGNSNNVVNYPIQGTNLSTRSSWGFGADIIPGYMITNNVLLYFRGGVVQTRFQDMHTNRNGWQLGAGGQTNVFKNLDLRADFIFSLYDRITEIGRPEVNQFNVGFVYKFPSH